MLLTSHSVLSCSVVTGQRLYSLTVVSKHFVTSEDGASLSPFMAFVQGSVVMSSWFVSIPQYYNHNFSFSLVEARRCTYV